MGWEETFLKFIRWLNRALLILFLLLAFFCANSQSYLRGEVRDENNNPLPNAQIILHSTGYTYYSGNGGYFGIMIPGKNDSLTISLIGYQQQSVSVNASILPGTCTENTLFDRELSKEQAGLTYKKSTAGRSGKTGSLPENPTVPYSKTNSLKRINIRKQDLPCVSTRLLTATSADF